jgi:hypothetical protein
MLEHFPTKRSELSRFFADVATDPDLLSAFIQDPSQVMTMHGISAAKRAAVMTGDPFQIQFALFEGNSSRE